MPFLCHFSATLGGCNFCNLAGCCSEQYILHEKFVLPFFHSNDFSPIQTPVSRFYRTCQYSCSLIEPIVQTWHFESSCFQ